MRNAIRFFAGAIFCMAVSWSMAQESAMDAVHQLATWKSVGAGLYQGFASCADLMKRSDFGILLFEGLDGDGILLDGRAYRFLPNGEAVAAEPTNTVCFGMVKVFESNQSGIRAEQLSLNELLGLFDTMLQTKNLPVAVKVDGDFATIRIASLTKQSAPYPTLQQVLEQQSDRLLTNVTGTLVGFRTPDYFGETSPTGYRLYFIKRDKKMGGRVLDLRARNVRFDFDYSHRLHIELPAWGEFYNLP